MPIHRHTSTYTLPPVEIEANPISALAQPASTNEIGTGEGIPIRGGFTQADRMLTRQDETNRVLLQIRELLESLNQQNSEHTGYLRRISRNTFKIRRIWHATLEILREIMREVENGRS